MKQYLLVLLFLLLTPVTGKAQIDNFSQQNQGYNEEYGRMENGGSNHFSWGRDTTKSDKPIPIGLFMWNIDKRLGDITHVEADTMMYRFQNFNNTDGISGSYNTLGNLGSPRMNRLFMDREVFSETFFMEPYSFFYTPVNKFMFTNTKSPFTNLSYHRAGTTAGVAETDENSGQKPPETGDTGSAVMLYTALAVCVSGMLAALMLYRKRKNNSDR